MSKGDGTHFLPGETGVQVDPGISSRPASQWDDPHQYLSIINKSDDNELKVHFLNAASDGLVREMVCLLNKGVNINSAYLQGGYTALMMAAMNDHVEVVRELVKRGADVNLRDKEGKTALQLCDNRKIQSILQGTAQVDSVKSSVCY